MKAAQGKHADAVEAFGRWFEEKSRGSKVAGEGEGGGGEGGGAMIPEKGPVQKTTRGEH